MNEVDRARSSYLQRVIELRKNEKLEGMIQSVLLMEACRAKIALDPNSSCEVSLEDISKLLGHLWGVVMQNLNLPPDLQDNVREYLLWALVDSQKDNSDAGFYEELLNEWYAGIKDTLDEYANRRTPDLPLPEPFRGESKEPYLHRVEKVAATYFDEYPAESRPMRFSSRAWDFMADEANGLSLDEIADKHGVSDETARKDIQAGRAAIQKVRPRGRPKKVEKRS